MKYEYTWNHLLLLAKVCGRTDDEDSVTASWVEITEEHNKQTFPFTLWPLTYRTCEVTTSPAMCTPIHIQTTDYNIKMFKSNEVVIVCIQDRFENSSRDSVCHHPCVAEFDCENDEDAVEIDTGSRVKPAPSDAESHVGKHSLSKSEPLIPCHEAHCYHRIKNKVNDAFYEIQENVECVICTGHGEAAAVASYLASDMSRTYEAEKEFLGLETTRVTVDFVGFSNSVVASPTYWSENSAAIDNYISVVFEGHTETTDGSVASDANLIVNPHALSVPIGAPLVKPSSMFRSMSVLSKLRNKTKRDSKVKQRKAPAQQISDYISALSKIISLPETSNVKL